MRSVRSPLLAVLLAALAGSLVARVRAADALDWKDEEKAALEAYAAVATQDPRGHLKEVTL